MGLSIVIQVYQPFFHFFTRIFKILPVLKKSGNFGTPPQNTKRRQISFTSKTPEKRQVLPPLSLKSDTKIKLWLVMGDPENR
jgi:hypothetical protein